MARCLGSHLVPLPVSMRMVFPCSTDEQGIGAHANAISFIGRGFLLPEDFRDHAEHRAAIEAESSTVEESDFDVAKMHGFPIKPEPFRISETAENGSILRSATSAAISRNFASPVLAAKHAFKQARFQ